MEQNRSIGFHIRAINPLSVAEIDLVAERMRATLIEVEGEETGTALYSMDWLRERVLWHLDATQVAARVLLAEDNTWVILGHTIVRREFEQDGREYGLISTTYVLPESRRLGVAETLLRAGEEWMRYLGLGSSATWTSSTNLKLIRMYEKHGYRQTATNVHETTGTIMVKLERNL
jgi:GNAT superfamily N-acetyltransferase